MLSYHNETQGVEAAEVISKQIRIVIAGVYASLTVSAISLNTTVLITFIKDRCFAHLQTV